MGIYLLDVDLLLMSGEQKKYFFGKKIYIFYLHLHCIHLRYSINDLTNLYRKL